MSIRRRSSQAATLTGGDLSVDILHTEDSVQLGDGTNLAGTFPLVGGLRSVPVANSTFATDGVLTGGTQRTKLTDGVDNVGIDTVGSDKCLMVSVMASVGGGSGTSATDSAAYTATSSTFTPVGGAFDDASSDALAEGEMGIVRMTSARAMHVYIAGQAPGGGGLTDTELRAAPVPVSGTVTVTDVAAIKTAVEIIDNAIAGNEMQVDIVSSALPSGAATEAKQDTAITSLQLIDDAIFTDDAAFTAATSKVMVVGGQYQASPNALDDGDAGSILIDSAHRVVVAVNTSVLPTGAATDASVLASMDTDAAAFGSVVTMSGFIYDEVAGAALVENSSYAARLDAKRTMINVIEDESTRGRRLTITASNAAKVDGSAVTQPVSIAAAVTVAGAAAHDAGISGNPVRVAGRAMLANGTAVAEDDTVDMACDNQGRQITTLHVPRDLTTHGTATITTTGETTIIAAGGAGVFHDLTKIILSNSSATATRVQVRDATGGTIRMEVALAANGGAVIDFGSVPMCATSANLAWYATLSGAVTSVYVYYQAIKRIA